jgi:hypothetical protein
VAGHVEFRNDANAAILRVGDELPNFRLRVVQAVGAHLLQLRKSLALDAEALVVGQMPVQNVHLHGGHTVEVALEHVQRNEVPAHIDEHAPPGKPRLIFYGDGRHGEAGGRDLDKLKKGLQAVQHAQRRWRGELSRGIGNGQLVRFILPEFLHGFAAVVGVNGQGGSSVGLGTKRNSRLLRKLRREPLQRGLERSIVRAGDRNRKGTGNRQLACSGLHARRHGHEVQLRLRLRLRLSGCTGCQHENEN